MIPDPKHQGLGRGTQPYQFLPFLDPFYYGNPLDYQWSQVNFGASEQLMIERERRLALRSASGSGGQRLLITPLTSASNYIVTFGIIVNNSRNNSNAQGGVLLYDGTKYVTMHQLATGGMEAAKWNNTGSFSATYWNSGWRNSAMMWYRWIDDGTNRLYFMSFDGLVFVQIYSIGRTDFCTPTHAGIFYDPNTGTLTGSITLFDFRMEPYQGSVPVMY